MKTQWRTAVRTFTKMKQIKNNKQLSFTGKMKKSQIQMGENVIILFIFFMLLIFAVVFYTKIQSTKTAQKIETDITGRGLQIAQRIQFLPELQCTKGNTEIFPGCYDEFNIIALDKLARDGLNREYYYGLFGFSRVFINRTFPIQDDNRELFLYNNPKEDWISITTTNVPLTLCNFISGEEDCSFAVLKVEVYN